MRIKYSKSRRKSHKRLFRELKGAYGRRKNLVKPGFETLIRARAYATRDRLTRKRDFRRLWITRISGACLQRQIRYSEFMHGLTLANVELNRKSLSELAITDPNVFDEIVAVARKALKA
jgi:large subunit ribosomal protein L20